MLDKCKVCKVTHGYKICAFEHNGDAKECPIPNDYITLSEHDAEVSRQAIEEFAEKLLNNDVVDKSVVRRVAERYGVGIWSR